MMKLTVNTTKRVDMIDITSSIKREIRRTGIKAGGCIIHIPHTTAAVSINENADPDVVRDIIVNINKMIPQNGDYQHAEGNSDSHIKCSLFNSSQYLIIENGEIQLGTWQGVYLCEFDGPRTREVWLQFMHS